MAARLRDVEMPQYGKDTTLGRRLHGEKILLVNLLAAFSVRQLAPKDIPSAEPMDRTDYEIEGVAVPKLAVKIVPPQDIVGLDAEANRDAAGVSLAQFQHLIHVPRQLIGMHGRIGKRLGLIKVVYRTVIREADFRQ